MKINKNTPQWFTEAIEESMQEVLQERLDSLERRLQHWLEVKLGLYVPSPYEIYFSHQILESAVDILDFSTINKTAGKPKKIRFFKNHC